MKDNDHYNDTIQKQLNFEDIENTPGESREKQKKLSIVIFLKK